MKDDDDFTEMFNALPEDLRDELLAAVKESDATSAEDLISQILVGECPQCLSSNTRDCEDVAETEDITIGLCKDCGHIWCTECGRTVTKGSTCEHWAICDRCRKKKDEFGDCGIPHGSARKLQRMKPWKMKMPCIPVPGATKGSLRIVRCSPWEQKRGREAT